MPRLKPSKIHSYFDCPVDNGLTCHDESLAQQHFEAECNINNIIARYESTGVLGDPFNPGTAQPMYGDFSSVEDFHTAQTIIAHSMEAFNALPAHVRIRFNNDPALMLSFLEEEENRDEAIKLGLVAKPVISDPDPKSDLVSE